MNIKKRIDILWPLYDINKNGYLEKDEAKLLFTDIFEQFGRMIDGNLLDNVLKAVDEDENDIISKEEFNDLLIEEFTQIN